VTPAAHFAAFCETLTQSEDRWEVVPAAARVRARGMAKERGVRRPAEPGLFPKCAGYFLTSSWPSATCSGVYAPCTPRCTPLRWKSPL